MKSYAFLLAISSIFLSSCATSTQSEDVQISDTDKVVVCGEVDGQKQTYPTLGDLKNDGAKFISYGPCYYQE